MELWVFWARYGRSRSGGGGGWGGGGRGGGGGGAIVLGDVAASSASRSFLKNKREMREIMK